MAGASPGLDGAGPAPPRSDAPAYRAFISYSHADAAAAGRLHRRLESYRLPRRLTASAVAGRRLVPIFRDREEFPAAGDLSAAVRAALAASACLIVVCSPAAAASRWVEREIALFRTLHPDRPILAALVAGTPATAFPAGLRGDAEPLAADFRRGGDGRRLALLKLVAALAGVGVDALAQRDAQRRLRSVTAVTVVALAAVIVMAVLTVVALNARNTARQQRAAAEGMVEFMLTDLRDRLKAVGRLDAMTSVNRRAMAFYAAQDLARLPPDSLERRARLLHAMGEDDETRGDLAAAEAKFAEARRTTAALLAAAPDDAERIFAHAQSEYWVGSIGWERGDYARAAAGYAAYARYADRLMAVEPGRRRSFQEVGYAAGGLCAVMQRNGTPAVAAVAACRRSLRATEQAAALAPGDPGAVSDVANRHAWLADALRAAGDRAGEARERNAQAALLSRLVAADPRDAALRLRWIWSERALAGVEAEAGQLAAARRRLGGAIDWLERMIRLDPANHDTAAERAPMRAELARMDAASN